MSLTTAISYELLGKAQNPTSIKLPSDAPGVEVTVGEAILDAVGDGCNGVFVKLGVALAGCDVYVDVTVASIIVGVEVGVLVAVDVAGKPVGVAVNVEVGVNVPVGVIETCPPPNAPDRTQFASDIPPRSEPVFE